MGSFLRIWFTENQPLILFVYGQAFFILGFAIAIQSRQYSRLNLARSLPWLAGFGVLHGFHEWGDLFIPIQQSILPHAVVTILQTWQLLLLAASFFCLFQFGIALFRPLPKRWQGVRFVSGVLLAVWLVGPFWIGLMLIRDMEQWHAFADAMARYLLCFPGGLIAAYGLLNQVHKQIQRFGLPAIDRAFEVAAATLAFYGIMGGLIVPPSTVFPGNIVNTDSFQALVIFPVQVFRSLAGLVLSFSIIRALDIFNIETSEMIRRMEETQVIAIERERIARDLHDNVLQQIYATGLQADALSRKIPASLRGEMRRLLMSINQVIDQLRAFLPRLQPDTQVVEIIPALTPLLEEAKHAILVDSVWDLQQTPCLNLEQINHLTAFTREAISNAIRHANSPRIEVKVACVNDRLKLSIHDFGKGMPDDVEEGYGLRNMRDRARLLNADFQIENAGKEGTIVSLDMPVECE